MAATKEKRSANGMKRGVTGDAPPLKSNGERPAKKAKLLDNTDDEDEDEDVGGVSLKVNEEYARRFEYNKKREEQHRCMGYCAFVYCETDPLCSGGKIWQGQGAAGRGR